MPDVLQQLLTPKGILFMPFLVGCMGSVTFGVVGAYVTVRRITYVAAAIAHSVLAGIGAAVFLQHHMGWAWCTPLLGAFIAAVLAALIIGKVTLTAEHLGDSVISAVMVIGMAAGLLLLKKTPGYFQPMSVLFGDILLVSTRDLWIIGAINAVTVTCGGLLYRKLLAVCFDEEYARLRGLRADLYYLLILLLTALTVVSMMQIVGIIMVIALLTLPAITSLLLVRKLWHCMILSAVLCILYVTCGLSASFYADMPSGPVIVMFAGAAFLATSGTVRLIRALRPNHRA